MGSCGCQIALHMASLGKVRRQLNSFSSSKVSAFTIVFLLAVACVPQTAFAQGPMPEAPALAVEPSYFASTPSPVALSSHRFFDAPNLALFTANAALNTADFFVTRSNLQSGGTELNPVVRVFGRSSAGLAVNFAGETAGIIGLSYILHKTGHHRLERLSSTMNIGASIGAVAYGLSHR